MIYLIKFEIKKNVKKNTSLKYYLKKNFFLLIEFI